MDATTRKKIQRLAVEAGAHQERRQAIRDALEAPVLKVLEKYPGLDDWKIVTETLEALHQAVSSKTFKRDQEKKRKERR
jgi:hypothetical protein